MDIIIIVLQLSLAGVLGVAAVGKALDLSGSRQAVHDFGIHKPIADPLGTALPAVELVLALLLLPGATARWAALGAALLFIAFIAGIGLNLSRGRQPDCHCFGQIHSSPAGWSTIVRNGIFTVMAAIIVWQGSPGPVDWFAGLSELSQIVVLFGTLGLLLGAAQVWLSLQMWQQNRVMMEQVGEAPASTLPVFGGDPTTVADFRARSAPPFDLPTVDGRRLTLRKLLASGKPVLLLFVDPGCGPCRHLVPDIHEWQRRFSSEITIALISRGSVEENHDKFGDLTVVLQEDREVYDLYDVEGTPSGVLLSRDGIIREPYAPGRTEIRELVIRTMRTSEEKRNAARDSRSANRTLDPDPRELLRIPTGPDVGTEGTRLPLPDLNGGYMGLDDLKGTRTALLFFSPDCVFCQRMLPDLQEWEGKAGDAVRHLLVISSGTEEANRELGLRSRLVIDDGFVTGEDYGLTGTPAAILIDEDGKVASPVAAGADAVLDLLYEQIEQPVEGLEASNA